MRCEMDQQAGRREKMNKYTEIAAQCWCDPRTERIEMDVRLAEVFAETL